MLEGNERPNYLTPEELSARFRGKISVRTLANWRCLGDGYGPRFTKIGGRILYTLSDVVSWERARNSGSTHGYKATA